MLARRTGPPREPRRPVIRAARPCRAARARRRQSAAWPARPGRVGRRRACRICADRHTGREPCGARDPPRPRPPGWRRRRRCASRVPGSADKATQSARGTATAASPRCQQPSCRTADPAREASRGYHEGVRSLFVRTPRARDPQGHWGERVSEGRHGTYAHGWEPASGHDLGACPCGRRPAQHAMPLAAICRRSIPTVLPHTLRAADGRPVGGADRDINLMRVRRTGPPRQCSSRAPTRSGSVVVGKP